MTEFLLTTQKQVDLLNNNTRRPCSRQTGFRQTYKKYIFELYLKQSYDGHLVYKHLKAQSSLNKMTSYSSGKEEMKHEMENPIQIIIMVVCTKLLV